MPKGFTRESIQRSGLGSQPESRRNEDGLSRTALHKSRAEYVPVEGQTTSVCGDGMGWRRGGSDGGFQGRHLPQSNGQSGNVPTSRNIENAFALEGPNCYTTAAFLLQHYGFFFCENPSLRIGLWWIWQIECWLIKCWTSLSTVLPSVKSVGTLIRSWVNFSGGC